MPRLAASMSGASCLASSRSACSVSTDPAPRARKLARDRARRPSGGAVVQNHISARHVQRAGNRGTDAPGGAGDEYGAAGKRHLGLMGHGRQL